MILRQWYWFAPRVGQRSRLNAGSMLVVETPFPGSKFAVFYNSTLQEQKQGLEGGVIDVPVLKISHPVILLRGIPVHKRQERVIACQLLSYADPCQSHAGCDGSSSLAQVMPLFFVCLPSSGSSQLAPPSFSRWSMPDFPTLSGRF